MRILLISEELKDLPKDTVYLHISNCSDSESYERYLKAHIDGAYFLSITGDLSRPPAPNEGRCPLPDMEDFKNGISKMGIGADSTVLVYSDSHLMNATRAWNMLKIIGVKNAYILYEGLNGYMRKSYPISSGEVDLGNEIGKGLDVDESKIIEYEFVRDNCESEDIVLIDSRNSIRFKGIEDVVDGKPGHIPGAVNYDFSGIAGIDRPQIEEIKEYFKDLDTEKEIIIYCGSGMTATINAALLADIGVDSKVYTGSYSEWINRI
ncbi:MAG: rhodanese-like domain-containing protein [Tissierellia bacterium]|nr:rhodanese-like domain-containing protein [Tissierellia bacterium]